MLDKVALFGGTVFFQHLLNIARPTFTQWESFCQLSELRWAK